MSLPKARVWPATDEAMQSRELVSTLAVPMKPFDQLVGGVIVLGQQLAGDIEGDGIRARAARSCRRGPARRVERRSQRHAPPRRSRDAAAGLPGDSVSPSAAPFEHSPPEIGRDASGSPAIAAPPRAVRRRRDDAAADAAVGAGGADGVRMCCAPSVTRRALK